MQMMTQIAQTMVQEALKAAQQSVHSTLDPAVVPQQYEKTTQSQDVAKEIARDEPDVSQEVHQTETTWICRKARSLASQGVAGEGGEDSRYSPHSWRCRWRSSETCIISV